jgi:cyclopropane-fatty-acyl-phospholipid synthase
MLFKFKSKAASDLIMLEPDARALLKLMLGDDPVKGIVLAKDMPDTLARLEAAMALESANSHAQHDSKSVADDESDANALENPVHFSQRAAPMVQMLKRCLAEKAALVWGV